MRFLFYHIDIFVTVLSGLINFSTSDVFKLYIPGASWLFLSSHFYAVSTLELNCLTLDYYRYETLDLFH